MSRYNSFKYGTGVLYGAESPATTTRYFTFIVDWDSDGYFTGENDGERMVAFSLTRGRDSYIRKDGSGFERYRTGQATIILDDSDGRYNPFNTSSPLYPNIAPGKPVRLAVLNGSAGTDFSLMRGRIADIQPFNDGVRRMVRIEVVDGQEFLLGRTVKLGYQHGTPYIPLTQGVDWTTGQWVDSILAASGWPDDWPRTYSKIEDENGNQLGAGAATENFYQWLKWAWFWNRDAMEAVRELEDAELGTFLHDRNGQARFFSSHFTYDEMIELDQEELLTDITTPMPWETIRNKIQTRVSSIKMELVRSRPWQIGGTGEDAILVPAESSRTFDAVFIKENRHVVPLLEAVVWSFMENSDDTGTDLTSQVVVQQSRFGDGATLIFQNTSATDGYIIELYVDGQALFAPFTTIIEAEDEASQDLYGVKALRIESPWFQDFDYAGEVNDILLANLKDPTQYPIIKIQNRPDIQFNFDLYSTVIHLTSAKLGINALYRVGKIEHRWLNENGQNVLTTLKLEPYFALDAPSVLDYDLFSPLNEDSEIDCSGSPPAGGMEWCFDPSGESANYPASYWGGSQNDFIYLQPSESSMDEAEAYTTGLSYVIPAEGATLMFDYQWEDIEIYGLGDMCHVILTTTESGEIINEPVTFLPTGFNEWAQMVFDLSEWAGETLTQIKFAKFMAFISVDTDTALRIRNVGLGKLIYDGR